MFQESFRSVSRKFQVSSKGVSIVSIILQDCFKDDSTIFEGCLKCVSRLLEECFMCVSRRF